MMPSEYMLRSYYVDFNEPTDEVVEVTTTEEDED